MQLLINHLTRMQPGWICTAGIDLESGRPIRPMAHGPLSRNLLHTEGGPLGLGHVVDLGATEFCGQVPEIEDRRFEVANLTAIRHADYQELFQACRAQAKHLLREIFGQDLQWINHSDQRPGTAAVEQYAGMRSLGCYFAKGARLCVNDSPRGQRLRILFQEEERKFSVPVTDFRLFLSDHKTPDVRAVSQMNQWLAAEPVSLVAVGLSRPYSYNDDPPQHWLQVNNVFPKIADLAF